MSKLEHTHRGLRRLATSLLCGGIVSLASFTASAQEAECAPTDTVDPVRLLRQASLDLRGQIPTFEEYERVQDAADPAAEVDSVVGEMVGSDEYGRWVREYHQSLIWANVGDSIIDNIFGGQARIRATSGADIYQVTNMARRYRGSAGIECLDIEQTDFDADGRPLPINTYNDASCDNADFGGTCIQEGYVWVNPYWAPETQVKVCAFDAMEHEVGVLGNDCSLYKHIDPGCGCGPNLVHCGRNAGDLELPFRDALTEEPLRVFEWIVEEDRSYLDAFTTPTTFVNGPLSHFYRNLSGVNDEELVNGPVSYDIGGQAAVPEIDYLDEDTWLPFEREGIHSGVLTSFGYLVRFASNRARANRFYTAFYCDPFVPPEDGIPAEGDDPSANLRERDGCDGCHEVLEPAAAHWGRWRTGGTYGYMREGLVDFDTPREECECGEGTDDPTCPQFCQRYFVTGDNAHPDEYAGFGGLPSAAAWLDDTDLANVDSGPAALLDTSEERRRLASCTVRNLATELLGRPLETSDLEWLDDETDAFEADDYRFTALVTRLLADRRYRSID